MADVEATRDGAVQTITLNRPEKMNAFTRGMHSDLLAALKQARDPEVRAVVVTGAGRAFCAGQDLTEFSETGDIGATLRTTYHPNVEAVRALEKPVIAAVNGACAGPACRSRARATSASPPTAPTSSPASSASGSFPTSAARSSSTGCSARRARSSGCRPAGA